MVGSQPAQAPEMQEAADQVAADQLTLEMDRVVQEP
tara:strand:+ start:402 stop:509 length:108 start_codon:yes stop_codon:yes gene_type:complete